MNLTLLTSITLATTAVTATIVLAAESVPGSVISEQRANLATNTAEKGFGPQSPRDIDDISGKNVRVFGSAPAFAEMNLCNIHLHESAEHKGGEFTTYLGNGDGEGHGTGYVYDGELTESELAPYDREVGATPAGTIEPGDTIEVHYVYTTAQITPGPTLEACLSEATTNPQLRVESQVFAVVNDPEALDFLELTEVAEIDGRFQAVNVPDNTGTPVEYLGSTTGPAYNEKGSPLEVSWSVRPEVAKVNIGSLDQWFTENSFEERSAQGARNLIVNEELLSGS